MRRIDLIVIHCSATRVTQDFSVKDLEACHLARGFKTIGYHYYITKDGHPHRCRPEEMAGAHARRYNAHSIGICYEGGLDAKVSGPSAPDAGTVERSAYAALMKPASSRLV